MFVKKRTPFSAIFGALYRVVDTNGDNLYIAFAHIFVPKLWATDVTLAALKKIFGDPPVNHTTYMTKPAKYTLT